MQTRQPEGFPCQGLTSRREDTGKHMLSAMQVISPTLPPSHHVQIQSDLHPIAPLSLSDQDSASGYHLLSTY